MRHVVRECPRSCCASKLHSVGVCVRCGHSSELFSKVERRRDAKRDDDSGSGHRPGGSLTPLDDKEVGV